MDDLTLCSCNVDRVGDKKDRWRTMMRMISRIQVAM